MGDQDFSEATKLKVKRRAGFQCCRCHSIGVEIHHILPQEYGGTNDIDNAAPLCPNCHSLFGDNPEKRKEIKQMRDWWYGCIERMYPDNRQKAELEAINSKIDQFISNQISLNDFKGIMFEYAQNIINNMTAGTAIVTASGLVSTSGSQTIRSIPQGFYNFPKSDEKR